jgi:hypothetical protein
VSLSLRHALESASVGLRQQQELVQSLLQSFLDSVSRLKVSGEDPVLFLAALSHSDPSLVFDYDNFSLLASFFGWDSPLNLSSTDPRSLSEWLRPPQPLADEAASALLPMDSASDVGASGLSSEEKENIPSALENTVAVDEPSLFSSREGSPVAIDTAGEVDLEDEGVPAPEDFNEDAVPDLSQQVEVSREFLSSFSIFNFLTLLL